MKTFLVFGQMASSWYPYALLAIGLSVSFWDVKFRVIPNVLIGLGLLIAFVWHSVSPEGLWAFDRGSPGATGLVGSLAAGLLMFALFFPLWLMNFLGAGDVKLLILVGAAFGVSSGHWTHLVSTIAYIACAGGGLVAVIALASGRVRLLIDNMKIIAAMFFLRAQGIQGPVFDAQADTAARMPYGVAIVSGATAFVLSESFL